MTLFASSATSSGVPREDDFPTLVAAAGADVDDVVRRLDDVEIVLDDDHRITAVDQLLQHAEQLLDVVAMQPGRRLVQYVERLAGGALAELLGELDALRLAARERRRRLAEMDVAEADLR